ncbi:MAG TPA: glycosyltransferase [Candidatus Dormibacteraeota bacterium]|nr:glycosyltransferase [Candidatus Dormibacteraeota bacterium]
MRVLQLGPYPPPYGGVQTNLVAIRSFLLRKGIPCAVINVTRHRKPDADDVYYPAGPIELLRLLARLRYDIVHQHFGGMLTNRILGLSLACTLRPGTKSVITFHSGGFPTTPEGMALGPNSFAGLVLRRFDGLIAVNAEIMGFFQKMKVSPDRARIISPYSFLMEDDSSSFPAPLAEFFAAHDPVLISAGQLEPEYDLPLQIDALPKLREKFPDAGLLLLGSGSIEKGLRAQIDARQCAAHILLAGDVPHAATIEAMARSRILLRTTWYDGDAISVREAMQVGTPVIATDNAMRPAGVRLIPKSDVAALLRVIEEELRKPAARKERTPADDRSVQQVFDFYQELLAGKSANPG